MAALLSPERPALPVPLSWAPQDARRRQDRRPTGPPPPLAHPWGIQGSRNDGLCFYHARFGNKAHKCERGCTYQEN